MRDRVPDDVAKHAGLTMAQAASTASILEPGELICPFAVIAKGADRQSIAFESETQDKAIAKGWASLDEFRDLVDLWALAREGLVSTPSGKVDVLVVAAWAPSMDHPVVFVQRFRPAAKGHFGLLGPIEVQGLPDAELERVGQAFVAGVDSHPKGHFWDRWRIHDA